MIYTDYFIKWKEKSTRRFAPQLAGARQKWAACLEFTADSREAEAKGDPVLAGCTTSTQPVSTAKG